MVIAMIRDIKESDPAEGTKELFLPGEMEWNAKRQRLQDHIQPRLGSTLVRKGYPDI
jgi:LDH2 family malate/lactate/ureidoglycolate dehydrogenase